ncbi:thiosulfate oxidation carrier complex protein SoxZ [Prosthecomicrobium sp. N25]|uniref:thiosulfate oxidation carrier complex protein SoxZ n=1 Tax=Prosthecomicrobium sp. N25 TaxID=3129254 RepID=UPI003076E4E6
MPLDRALVNMPPNAARGEVVTVKTLIRHPMESGFRPGPDGKLLPRDIIASLVARYAGREVFRMELFPAIAANPLVAFPILATETGEVEIRWTDEKGEFRVERKTLTVT